VHTLLFLATCCLLYYSYYDYDSFPNWTRQQLIGIRKIQRRYQRSHEELERLEDLSERITHSYR
jgi:hypothetical protein